MEDEAPIRKGEAAAVREDRPARPRRMFGWRLLDAVASSVFPLLVLAIIAGFTSALCVELFEWAWEIVR